MAQLHTDVYDSGLDVVADDATALHICSQEPSTVAEATSTYTLGNKAGPTISAPGARGAGGREVTISAIADGVVTSSGTATHWALVDSTGGGRLLAVQGLAAPKQIVTGNPFTLGSFTIGIPAPAA